MKFNEKLRNEREDRDITQTELGEVLKMSQRKISRLERGDTEPTTDEIIKICSFFEKTADYMLGLTDK